MDEELPLVGEGRDKQFQQVLAHGGGPAFVARGKQCQEAWHQVLRSCRHKRAELLAMVGLRLGQLYALAGDWAALQPWMTEDHLAFLQQLHDELQPKLRMPVERSTSRKLLRRALLELKESMQRFNDRWREFLDQMDLAHVNELRDKYNKYYVLEKECIVRSPILARRGFQPLKAVTLADVEAEFPPLEVVELKEI